MKTYTTQFIFNIPKENKKYLVMQNLRYYSSTATIENHRINPVKTYTIQHILFISFCVIFSITVLSVIFCKKCRKTSNKNDNKNEEPLSKSNENNNSTEEQPYSSSQSNPQNRLFPPQENYYSGGGGIYETGNTN